MKPVVFAVACLFASSQFNGSVAFAQSNAEGIPADAILSVEWAGLERVSSEPGTHLHELLKKSSFREIYQGIAPAVSAILQVQEPMMADTMMNVYSWAKVLIDRPTTLYVGPADPNGPMPFPKAALICRAGEGSAAVHARLQQLQAEWGEVPLVLHLGEGIVGLSTPNVGPADLVRLGFSSEGTAPTASLASQPRFAARAGPGSMFSLWLDAKAAMTNVEQMMGVHGPAELEQWMPIKEMLGLAGLEEVRVDANFADAKEGGLRGWTVRSFLGAPAPRKGVLALLEGSALSERTLASIPVTASLAGGIRLDVPGMINSFVEIASKVEPSAVDEYHQGLMMASEMLEMDVQSELLDTIGTDWAYYCDRSVGGSGLLGLVLVHQPKDAAKLSTAVAKIMKLANSMIDQEMADAPVKLNISQLEASGLAMHCWNVPFIAPCLTFHEDRMYVALYPAVLVEAVESAKTQQPSMLTNSMMRRFASEEGAIPSYFHYEDLPASANENYSSMLMLSQMYAGIAGLAGVEASPMLLPPLSQLKPHLEPHGVFAYSDDSGIHGRMYGPFPGASSLSASQWGSAYMMTIGFSMLGWTMQARAMNQMMMVQNLGYAIEEVEIIEEEPPPPEEEPPPPDKDGPDKDGRDRR